MRFHKLRIRLANWLTGKGMEWNTNGVIDTPYARLCKLMHEVKDSDLPECNRVLGNMYKKAWLERTIEVTKMHRAFTRKNRQIAALKAKVIALAKPPEAGEGG